MKSSDNIACHIGWAISLIFICWGLYLLNDRVEKLEAQHLQEQHEQ